MRLPAFITRFVPSAALSLLTWITEPSARSQSLTQPIPLLPGWNAVWLEVDPPDRRPETVFAGLPVASVWTWSERVSATDFIQNPETAGWNRAQWLAYFPPENPEAPLANLYAVLPQRAYLIRLAGTNAVNWSVTGRPVIRSTAWIPDRFNLRGFPIDDATAPTFQQFFRPSPAHSHSGTGALEAIYRLSPNGQWTPVAPTDRMRRGEACWVYTRGASDYVAPFHLSLNSGETLDFNGVLRRIELTLHNTLAGAKSIRLEPASLHASPLLLLPPPAPGQTNTPRPIATHDQPVAANSSHRLYLGLDRSNLAQSPATDPATGIHASVLRLSDGEGTQYHLALSAVVGETANYTGLWLGSISITNVLPVTGIPSDPTTPGPVAAPFPLRLLVHVDNNGHASLLRDVTLVYTRATGSTNTSTLSSALQATELVTDPARLVTYPAADLRTGTVRGRRLTAPHFDFVRTNGQFTLALSGAFSPGSTISGSLLLPGDVPTNPFLHRYHPDHGTNAYAVTRELTLTLASVPALALTDPAPTLTGTYAETITGLHRFPLLTSGTMELRRISDLGVLNTATR